MTPLDWSKSWPQTPRRAPGVGCHLHAPSGLAGALYVPRRGQFARTAPTRAAALVNHADSQIFMGLQDRDWYQKALSEREKQRKIDETRSRFSVFSRKHLGAKIVSPTKTGFIPMMVFWCAVMGLLYMLMTHYLKPKPLVMSASGELIMPRARDGHFYARGEVNGKRVSFLVDTGCLLGHRQ